MSRRNDHTPFSFSLALLVILLLAGLTFVPGGKAVNVEIKHVNILSDLISFDHPASRADSLKPAPYDDGGGPGSVDDNSVPFLAIADDKTGDSTVRDTAAVHAVPDSVLKAAARQGVVGIEDFGSSMTHFYEVLRDGKPERPVRIAVLGDSFIEGDIITADLREQLQDIYGGRGVGFIPFSSPFLKVRGTVRHSSDGWTNYSILNRGALPEVYRDKFFISGMLSVPGPGASLQFSGVGFRKHIRQVSRARLFFINGGNSSLDVIVNDSIPHNFIPESSPFIQYVTVGGGGDIDKISLKVNDPAGFIGYGMVLDDGAGISVDNFSLRSNSGIAMVGTNGEVNRQMNRMLDYDLVILQYGLNAMSPEVVGYSSYSRQMCRVIEHIKACFPEASVLVMSIGDRSTRKDGYFVTMPAVYGMVKAQRNAAEMCGVAFWNTFQAMGGPGSMIGFVSRGWAAKDYTHMAYSGGRQIARKLTAAIEYGKTGPLNTHADTTVVNEAGNE